MLPPEPTLPEDLAAAWDSVLSDWSAESRHTAFIELCALHGRLGDAGALYRRTKEQDEARAELAEQQLQRILARAMATLTQQPPGPANVGARRVVLLVAVVVAALLMGSAAWAAARLMAHGSAS